ncbi:MAG: UvrD-helicase domain-containing protein [Coprococcus comes]
MRHWQKFRMRTENSSMKTYFRYFISNTGCLGTRHKHIKHLVIDEMQDYSYLQYVVLSQLFSCRMTILGDRAQTWTVRCRMYDIPADFGRTIRKIIMIVTEYH